MGDYEFLGAIHVKEELADVMIYCLSLANQLDIDISTAIENKIKKNSIKYPIPFKLPNDLKGRSLHEMAIPTVCNLENMLNKLIKVNGDFNQLKQWEKRGYKAYNIDEIVDKIISSEPEA